MQIEIDGYGYRYTQVDYTSPVVGVPSEGTGISTFVVKSTFWSCNECSALVLDQEIHDWWHRSYVHVDDVKPWWRRIF